MEQPIGVRLRQMRLRHRLSQRQLARQSGVANATISQIEAGKLNPTVSMLKKVLDGIPVRLSEFFGDEPETPDRIFSGPTNSPRSPTAGRLSCRWAPT
jgi:transcriptional regulator with XRE-family HTH domain